MIGKPRLPWLLALPLMAAGGLAAHAASLAVTTGEGVESAHEAGARTSTGLAGHSVLLLAVLATLVLVGLVRQAWATVGRRSKRAVSPWWFFVLPLLGFALLELSERLLHAESFPFSAALEPRFLVGLLLQLPFSVAAFALARLLLRVAERIGRALAGHTLLQARPTCTLWAPSSEAQLRPLPALAVGHAQRGPPR